VRRGVREDVDRDDERHAALLEPADHVEAGVQAPGVDQHDRAEGALEQAVPQEPEALLPGRAEQVEHQLLVDADPAEVHGHGGRVLLLDPADVVHADADLGHRLLGRQGSDLADRADQGRLADPEAADDDDLDGGGGRGGQRVLARRTRRRVRASGVHTSLP
jgi:hypothetical protein